MHGKFFAGKRRGQYVDLVIRPVIGSKLLDKGGGIHNLRCALGMLNDRGLSPFLACIG